MMVIQSRNMFSPSPYPRTSSSTIQGLFQVCQPINASEGCRGLPWIYIVIYKSDLFLSWSWLEVSDRQSALTPPYPTHPTLTHCAASQQAPRWHFLEKQARCQQQYVSFHIVTVSARVRGGREWEKRDGRFFFAGLQCCLWHSASKTCLYWLFLWGGEVAQTSTKAAFQTCWLTLKKTRFQECCCN